MKNIKQTYLINAPVEKVWQALVDPKIIDDWGGGEAKMSEEEGFEFSLRPHTLYEAVENIILCSHKYRGL